MVNGHSSYPNDLDRALDGLVCGMGEVKHKHGPSSICVPAKGSSPCYPCGLFVLGLHETGNIGGTFDHRTTPIPAHTDSTPSSTREQLQPQYQLDPTLESGQSEPRAVHADPSLDPADLEIEPSTASGSERLRLDIEHSEPASDADDDAPGSEDDDRWEYRRIKARRIDASGRRMARVEWKDTWEPEDELDGLKMALRQYARERQANRDSEGTCSKCGARKRRCPV